MAGIASYVNNQLLGGAQAVGAPDFYGTPGASTPILNYGLNTGPVNTAQNIVNNITTSNGLPIQTRDGFLHALESWESSISLNSLWMVFFTVPDRVNDNVMKSYGEHILDLGSHMDPSNAGIGLARKKLLRPELNRTLGCVFAQTVGLPPEQNATHYVGPDQRGFLKGPVLEQRQQFSSINIEFLETGISFVDFLIRPWTIISGHEGYVARPGGNLGADIMLINFMRGGVDMGPAIGASNPQGDPDTLGIENKRGFVPRKMWLFEDCIPVNISAERYSYTPEGAADRRDTEWIFKKYQIILPNVISNMDQFQATEKDKVYEYWDNVREAGKKVYSALKSPHGIEESTKAQVDLQDAKTYWSGNNKRDDKKYNQAAGSEEAARESGATSDQTGGPSLADPGVGQGGHSKNIGQSRTDSQFPGNSRPMRYAKPRGVVGGSTGLGHAISPVVEAQAKKYWRGERTEHHLANEGKELEQSNPYRGEFKNLGNSRGGTEKPIKYAKPYGVNMKLGSEGTSNAPDNASSFLFDDTNNSVGPDAPAGTTYRSSGRENAFRNASNAMRNPGAFALTKFDANLYWQGKPPYVIKPTNTGAGGDQTAPDMQLKGNEAGKYPMREIGPRGPMWPANPYPSGRPDRMSILSLFGL